jgi:hypothetical protein
MKKLNYTDIIDKNIPEAALRQCCFRSCGEEGRFPAPKSREHLQQRYWFCLEHVRRYNASWNYFSGMDEAEIHTCEKDALAGHRPTWKIGMQPSLKEQRILDHLAAYFSHTEKKSSPPPLPATEREALAALNLSYPVTLKDIKKRYKELVKLHHPDVNQDTSGKEKFVIISTAYHTLLNCGYFTS